MKLITTTPQLPTQPTCVGRRGCPSGSQPAGNCATQRACRVERALAGSAALGLMTVREAAQLASVHEETVRRAYRANLLAVQRLGTRSIRIHPSDLSDWMGAGMPCLGRV